MHSIILPLRLAKNTVAMTDEEKNSLSTATQAQRTREARPAKHLELAYQNICDSWFPANPELLKTLKLGLASGYYDQKLDLLIKELQSDVSLFSYAIRELVKLTNQDGMDGKYEVNPIQLFHDAGIEGLKKILSVEEGDVSLHRLGSMTYVQSRRLLHSVLSATTAELLGETYDIEPSLAYSCAVFRQLGLSLIAWNYPHVYQRIVLSLKPGETLDTSLSKTLGFAPSILGFTIARRWHLAPEIRAGMGDSSVVLDPERAETITRLGETLSKVCSVGEALARASDPDHYPSATADWEIASKEIEGRLGKQGFQKLKALVSEHCEAYSKVAPDLFEFPETLDPKVAPGGVSTAPKTANSNQYLRHCPEKLKSQLGELYANLDSKTVSKENIDFLVKNIIPGAGFKRGCIYLINPDSRSLSPRLCIGDSKMKDFLPINYPGTDSSNPILAAYKSGIPLADQLKTDSETVQFVAGILGNTQRVGVLYLELSDSAKDDRSFNAMMCFKAIRQALNDCLSLH